MFFVINRFHPNLVDILDTSCRRIRHNSNDVPGEQYQCIPMLDTLEDQTRYTDWDSQSFIFFSSEEGHSWVDSLPFEIPFGLATTFKSDEDWLDDWEEL